jgi:hypothetical protein
MALIEIKEASRSAPGSGRLRGFAIDAPEVGAQSDMWSIYIAGWAWGREAPVEAVEFVCQDVILRSTPVGLSRPDVAAAQKAPEAEKSGFSTVVGLLGLPWQFEIQLRARLKDGRRAHFGTIRGRRESLRSGFKAELDPLMVTSILGRTGRTWIMHLLAQHPQIVADRVYPYETLSASYWLHQLKVCTEPANPQESSGPDTFLGQPWFVGAHPFNNVSVTPKTPPAKKALAHWFGRPYVEQMAAFSQASIEGYYKVIAASQGQTKPQYFAEKYHPWHIPRIVWDIYPKAREVFLIRDFRDMVCSVMAFNAKRGFASFGRERFANDADYIRGPLRMGTQHLFRSWLERRERALFIRYEDVVLRPEESLKRILEYLNLNASTTTINDMIESASLTMPELEKHKTSRSPTESIARWRRDLSPELKKVCDETFGEVLREFGYD